MGKRVLLVVLLAGTLAAPAQAEWRYWGTSGGDPLATWCATPALNACFSLTSFSSSYMGSMIGNEADYEYGATGYLSGSDFMVGNQYIVELYFFGGFGLGLSCDAISWSCAGGNNVGGGGYFPEPPPVAAQAFNWLSAHHQTPVFECSPNGEREPACHTVPEPSTGLLLGTGLLAIGFMAWRRKEEDETA